MPVQGSGHYQLWRRDAGAQPLPQHLGLHPSERREVVVVILQQRGLTVADKKDAAQELALDRQDVLPARQARALPLGLREEQPGRWGGLVHA
jgi:hypothetical protein